MWHVVLFVGSSAVLGCGGYGLVCPRISEADLAQAEASGAQVDALEASIREQLDGLRTRGALQAASQVECSYGVVQRPECQELKWRCHVALQLDEAGLASGESFRLSVPIESDGSATKAPVLEACAAQPDRCALAVDFERAVAIAREQCPRIKANDHVWGGAATVDTDDPQFVWRVSASPSEDVAATAKARVDATTGELVACTG